MPDAGRDSLCAARLREWLEEEESRVATLRAIAERHDRSIEDEVDLHRSANRAEATARRIRAVLDGEASRV